MENEMMEREEYPELYQVRHHTLTCKPGFDDWCKTVEESFTRLAEMNSALRWYIRTKPEMSKMPSEDDMYPEWGPWNRELLKLYNEATEAKDE